MAAQASEWEKHVDEASGSAYYHNTRTGESSWEVPAGFLSPRASDSPDKPKWRRFVDEESGATYYHDEASGISRWDKPEDFVPESEEQEQETQKAEEQEDAEAEDPQNEAAEPVSNGKETQSTVQWLKYVDAASHKPYYHNPSTGKTQWEEPEDFDESAAPVAPQISAEYQTHLNRVRTERLTRVTQQVADPSGNLSKLNAILSGIDSSAPSTVASTTSKAEWQQHIDSQTQRYYYHNVVTGVTQWNKPDAPIVSGLADWIPPEVSEPESTDTKQKTVSGVNYVAQAKFNRVTGKYEQLGGDDYWQNVGVAPDREGRQMSHFFDMNELEKNREEAQRRKEQLKRKNIDWKKRTAEKKAKKQKQRNEWLFID
ncbi:hypothetical protein PHMEG_00036332 [Phytophthora megakarya]|uniref:WW domain-containing protein n=1 Tax=Phytophthora megakarya TaxID=4795 RepID=A0A225UM88_9STRA|nr:hypothetical protein PHMEG_00036332 [Phytophthora megakarya]